MPITVRAPGGRVTAFTFAPFASSSLTAVRFWLLAAFISGVWPVISGAFTSRPASTSSRMVSMSLPLVAIYNAVFFALSIALIFAPFAISSRTVSTEGSLIAAISSGVCPSFEAAFTSAPCATSIFALRVSAAAQINAVEPKVFFALTSAPLSRRYCIASGDPIAAAYMRGVIPRSSARSTPDVSTSFASAVKSLERRAA